MPPTDTPGDVRFDVDPDGRFFQQVALDPAVRPAPVGATGIPLLRFVPGHGNTVLVRVPDAPQRVGEIGIIPIVSDRGIENVLINHRRADGAEPLPAVEVVCPTGVEMLGAFGVDDLTVHPSFLGTNLRATSGDVTVHSWASGARMVRDAAGTLAVNATGELKIVNNGNTDATVDGAFTTVKAHAKGDGAIAVSSSHAINLEEAISDAGGGVSVTAPGFMGTSTIAGYGAGVVELTSSDGADDVRVTNFGSGGARINGPVREAHVVSFGGDNQPGPGDGSVGDVVFTGFVDSASAHTYGGGRVALEGGAGQVETDTNAIRGGDCGGPAPCEPSAGPRPGAPGGAQPGGTASPAQPSHPGPGAAEEGDPGAARDLPATLPAAAPPHGTQWGAAPGSPADMPPPPPPGTATAGVDGPCDAVVKEAGTHTVAAGSFSIPARPAAGAVTPSTLAGPVTSSPSSVWL